MQGKVKLEIFKVFLIVKVVLFMQTIQNVIVYAIKHNLNFIIQYKFLVLSDLSAAESYISNVFN